MGLFGLFGGKKKGADSVADQAVEPADEKGDASPWPKRLKGFGDWDDDKKKAVGKEFLADIGTKLVNPTVKEMLDEDDLELRARFEDIPVRVKYELDMGWVSLEMKCATPIDDLEIEWDPKKIPVHSDGDDDWGDDDEIRAFVGKGVFIEGDKDEVNNSLAILASLPVADQIVETIERLRLTRFYIFSESIDVGFDDNSYEMADPVAMVSEAIAMMASVARVVGTATIPAPGQTVSSAGVTIVPVNLVNCTYCSTKFNLGANSRCPNCGGAFEG
jgi:hypothetical protein